MQLRTRSTAQLFWFTYLYGPSSSTSSSSSCNLSGDVHVVRLWMMYTHTNTKTQSARPFSHGKLYHLHNSPVEYFMNIAHLSAAAVQCGRRRWCWWWWWWFVCPCKQPDTLHAPWEECSVIRIFGLGTISMCIIRMNTIITSLKWFCALFYIIMILENVQIFLKKSNIIINKSTYVTWIAYLFWIKNLHLSFLRSPFQMLKLNRTMRSQP